MISAATVQALLLGSGGFIGTSMAGVGAFRLFTATTRGAMHHFSAKAYVFTLRPADV